MPLQKASVNFNFSGGMDTLTDPNQVAIGKFTSLENSVFIQDEGAAELNKRSGYPGIGSAPDATGRAITTFRNNILVVGDKVQAFSAQNNSWINAGTIQPLELSVLSLNRNYYPPLIFDSVQSPSGLICIVFSATNSITLSGSYFYAVYNQNGQSVVAQTSIPSGFGTETNPPRVYFLNNRFVIVFDGNANNLQYLTIDATTLAVTAAVRITSTYVYNKHGDIPLNHDGAITNNTLYLSFPITTGIAAATINSAYVLSAVSVIGSGFADMLSVCIDTSSGTSVFTTWVPSYRSHTAKVIATDQNFNVKFSQQTVVSSGGFGIVNLTSAAMGGVANSYFEVSSFYQYNSGIPSNWVSCVSTATSGSVSNEKTVVRSVGLASKAFVLNSYSCFLSEYYSPLQSTYFLHANTFIQNFQTPNNQQINTTTISKLAQGNAYSAFSSTSFLFHYVSIIPSVTVIGSSASTAYLLTTTVTPVNKQVNVSSANLFNAVFDFNPGLNYATFDFGTKNFQTKEIGSNLNMNGGLLWGYDGNSATENNFLLYPDNVQVVGSGISGAMTTQTYYYQAIYQWNDAQGNIQRSAPSVPIPFTPGTVTIGSSSVPITGAVINVPCLRVGAKPISASNPYNPSTSPVVISLFRWSQQQQIYYKIAPGTVQNIMAAAGDSITFVDNAGDYQIIGNEILYTNNGTVENSSAPSPKAMTIFDSRLWVIDAEDENQLWFSQPVSAGTPVEMSDLLTYFVPPDITGIGNTGGVKSLGAMDDKLILFKKNSMFYIGGTGPDLTGVNNQYSSSPIFITSGIGCVVPNSIVLIPAGLMFQSDKGIWLLGRDLVTRYIGKEMEDYNTARVMSANNVPATNEVRFTLGSSDQTIVYDYLAGQWNQTTNVPAVSATITNNSYTQLSVSGSISQETMSTYLDSAGPVQMSFTTGWINLAGLQGYVRAYRMFVLGTFYSPHTYTVGIAYNYDPTITQTATIRPQNVVGSGSFVEQWQINFNNQQCQSFRLTFHEISSGSAGQGLSLSGFKLVYGVKKDFPRNIPATQKTS